MKDSYRPWMIVMSGENLAKALGLTSSTEMINGSLFIPALSNDRQQVATDLNKRTTIAGPTLSVSGENIGTIDFLQISPEDVPALRSSFDLIEMTSVKEAAQELRIMGSSIVDPSDLERVLINRPAKKISKSPGIAN